VLNGVGWLFLAMFAFVGGHFFLSWPPVRSRIVERIREPAFAGAYSLLMVLFLIGVVWAYRESSTVVIWDSGMVGTAFPVVLMPFALMVAVTGLIGKNPTALMGDALFTQGVPVTGILTVTRHPFLSGAALWSLSHLIANGDLASILLFGGMAILSVFGMGAIDHKRALKLGEAWASFAGRTSRVPFAAALAGKVKVDWARIGWTRPALGLILYALLYAMHDRLFGVPVVFVR
jgi:uncharacterized membrane protein